MLTSKDPKDPDRSIVDIVRMCLEVFFYLLYSILDPSGVRNSLDILKGETISFTEGQRHS